MIYDYDYGVLRLDVEKKENKLIQMYVFTFRSGLVLDGPPFVQLNFFDMCMERVSSGRAQACFVFVSEFDIESCSKSSSYKGRPPRAADARDMMPAKSFDENEK